MVDFMLSMTDKLSPQSLILVVVMNNPRDFEIARLLGWYRIPLRSAPKIIAVDYLAFYQTASFKESKWQISYIAPVLGHELTTRKELLHDEPDHPRANQEYYKIQIGPLQFLQNPIQAGDWRRITFLYTTGDYFNRAQSVNDLVIHSDERQMLWKALRDRAAREQSYHATELPEIELDPEILAMLLGINLKSGPSMESA
jgi:hypothetical protein